MKRKYKSEMILGEKVKFGVKWEPKLKEDMIFSTANIRNSPKYLARYCKTKAEAIKQTRKEIKTLHRVNKLLD